MLQMPLTSRATVHSLIVVLVAAAFCLPYLINGVPPIGDSVTHSVYQYHFSHQFWSGDVYPRWLPNANKGYGSPIFLIQYPLPYWLTALLRPMLRFSQTPSREARELGVFCFLAMAAAGLAARAWFRNRYSPLTATAAAIIYIGLPYSLAQNLYESVAIGQLSAAVWMPLALALCDSLQPTFVSIGVAGIVMALMIMSNPIIAFLFGPLMLAYALTCRLPNNLPTTRRVIWVFLTITIGTGIGAVYVLPLVFYGRLFDISALPRILPGFTMSNNFSLLPWSSLPKSLVVAFVAVAVMISVAYFSIWRAPGSWLKRASVLLALGLGALMIVPGLGPKIVALSGLECPRFDGGYFPERMLATALLTFMLGALAYFQASTKSVFRNDRVLLTLLVAACGAFILMLPWSAFLWRALPALSAAIQFPHRLCEILTLATAGLVAPAIEAYIDPQLRRERIRLPSIFSGFAVAVILVGILAWRTDWRWAIGLHRPGYTLDATREVDIMYRTYISQDHLASFAAMLGTAPNTYYVGSTPINNGDAVLVQGRGTINVTHPNPRTLLISYTLSEDGTARLAQLYWPLWTSVPKRVAPTSSADGLMQVPLIPGGHEVELQFDGGWPERYGVGVTLVSIAVVLGGLSVRAYAILRQRSQVAYPSVLRAKRT